MSWWFIVLNNCRSDILILYDFLLSETCQSLNSMWWSWAVHLWIHLCSCSWTDSHRPHTRPHSDREKSCTRLHQLHTVILHIHARTRTHTQKSLSRCALRYPVYSEYKSVREVYISSENGPRVNDPPAASLPRFPIDLNGLRSGPYRLL